MPRRKPENPLPKRNASRPKLDLDWDTVDKYLASGCSGAEVASTIGMAADTLYQRTEIEKGMTFSAYAQKKKEHGNSMIRAKQFQVAMQGNTTMLVWLGKNSLSQKDGEPTGPTTVNLVVERKDMSETD